MDIASEIKAARKYGVTHCGISDRSHCLATLAAEFLLATDSGTYREIDQQEAAKLLTLILHCDLAYSAEIMPESDAVLLAQRFLNCVADDEAKYFTNGTFHDRTGGARWNPATDATFDTGVLVLSNKASGCLWVEDED